MISPGQRILRTLLALVCLGSGGGLGVRTWLWVQGDTGVLWGAWAWAMAVPILLGSLSLIWAALVLYRSTDLPRGQEPVAYGRVLGRLVLALLALSSLSTGAFLWPARQVVDDEMAWSIQSGEWVWVLPVEPEGSFGVGKGDVVLLADPLDPSREVLRRIVAGPGQSVEVVYGELKLRPHVSRKVMNEAPIPWEGRSGTWNVHTETLFGTPPKVLVEQGKREKLVPGEGPDKAAFLTLELNKTLYWRTGQGLPDESTGSGGPPSYRVEVPEGYWYVMADDRDVALDSRWWGPIAETDIRGVIRLHRAEPDIWREEWQVLRPVE